MKKINKIMSIGEIDKKLKGKWILIDKPERKNHVVVKGNVLYCGNRDEVLNKAGKLFLKDSAFLLAGGATAK